MLGYLGQFYPGAKVIIADGSTRQYQTKNEDVCAQASGQVEVDYRAFDPEMPMFNRIHCVLQDVPEDHYVLGADDDYPVLEVLADCKDFLNHNPDYSACGGVNFQITLKKNLSVRREMINARSVEHDRPADRCRFYADLAFPTYYSVASRSHLLSRYELFLKSFIVGFGDYALGLHDLTRGKLHVLNAVSYIRTMNAAHSYVRVTKRLGFLHNAPRILDLQEHIAHDLLAADMALEPQDAERMSETFITERIHLLTRPDLKIRQRTVESEAIFRQFKRWRSPLKKALAPRLGFIEEQLKAVQMSDDNEGEANRRTSVDG